METSLLIYIGIIFLTVFCTTQSFKEKNSKKIKIFFMILAIIIPSVFAGIRYNIGTDYKIHEMVFNEIANGEEITKRAECGYVLLNKILAILGGNYNTLLFIITIISMTCVYLTLKQYKDKISAPIAMLAYMLLYYQMSYNLIRQIFAATIVLYATTFLYKNQKWKFVFGCILASTIHITASIYLIMLLGYSVLTKEKYQKFRIILYIILTLVVFTYPYIILPILNILQDKIPSLEYFFNYLKVEYKPIGIGILRYIILFIIPGILTYTKMKKDEIMLGYYHFSILGFILWLTSYISSRDFYRISYTILLSIIPLIGYYWKNATNIQIKFLDKFQNGKLGKILRPIITQKEKLFKVAIILLLFFFWYYDFFYLKAHATVPYQTILGGF